MSKFAALFLLMFGTFFLTSTTISAQTCSELELNVGDVIDDPDNCFQVLVPIYFDYDGAGAGPSSVLACGLTIEGHLDDIDIADIILPSGSNFTATNTASDFTVTGPSASTEYSLKGTDTDPYFYVAVARPNSGSQAFDLFIDDVDFTFGSSCTGANCDLNGDYNLNNLLSAASLSTCSGNDQVTLFVDVDNPTLAFNNATGIVQFPVKIAFPGSPSSVTVDQLNFEIEIDDVLENLSHSAEDPATNVSPVPITDGYSVDLSNYPFDDLVSGEQQIFDIQIQFPQTPQTGGEAKFNFTKAKVELNSTGTCCRPISISDDYEVDSDSYPQPCTLTEFFEISAPTFGANSAEMTVSLNDGGINDDIDFDRLFLEIVVESSDDYQIDETATEASIENDYCPGGTAPGFPSNCIEADATAGTVVYGFAFTENIVGGTPIFKIILSGDCGGIDNVYFKQVKADVDGGTATYCRADFTVDNTISDYVSLEGEIVSHCSGIDPPSSVEVFVNEIEDINNPSLDDPDCDGTPDEEYTTNGAGLFSDDLLATEDDRSFRATACLESESYRCGVTTFDLVLISKHILNVQTFTKPEEYIAADVNESGTVTTLDLIKIRQLVLAINDDFDSDAPVWRFIDCDFDFTDEEDPFLNDEHLDAAFLTFSSDNACDVCFSAIKMGDVNCSCMDNAPVIQDTLYISLNDISGSGSVSSWDFEPLDGDFSDIAGIQFALSFDETSITYDQFNNSDLDYVDTDVFGTNNISNGELLFSWFEETGERDTLSSGETLFSLDFNEVPLKTVNPPVLDESKIAALAYKGDGSVWAVRLTEESRSLRQLPQTPDLVDAEAKDVFKTEMVPNPSQGQIPQLWIQSPVNSSAVLHLLDAQGRIVHQQKLLLDKGRQHIDLAGIYNQQAGFYFYRLYVSETIQSGKFILN